MEIDWSKYAYLEHYNKYSSSSCKDFSAIVDKILSYIPNNKNSKTKKTDEINPEELTNDNVELKNLSSLDIENGILGRDALRNAKIEGGSTLDPPNSRNKKSPEKENEFSKIGIKKVMKSDSSQLTDYSNNSNSTSLSTDSSGSDLIFDMKYCSLQLPIPLEVCEEQDEDYTLETNSWPSITEYDVCYEEELASNYIMVEPFRFLSKVHLTFDKESGEQWCCCYFDAIGNYTKKRFNTSNIAFDTAKILANRCREAAEQSFHNIWILKHKNILNRPIPDKITESFIVVVNKIREYLTNEGCMVCCVDKIRETLHSIHQKNLN